MTKALSPLSALANQPMVSASIALTRLDRPVGIYLVLWPTLWALWLASEGLPRWQELFIFMLGGTLMRSAGCVINDYADRRFDGHVKRTKSRPLVSGKATPKFALGLFIILTGLSAFLVLFTNILTILTAFGAIALATTYPYMKRHTYMPQVVLGAAFAWAIPMAFAAVQNELPSKLWNIYIAVLLWVVAYDTFYGMVDREDDLKIGVKSTAILFAEHDRLITTILQLAFLVVMLVVGATFELKWPYYLSLLVAGGLFAWQQYIIKERAPQKCFDAFLNNNWVGMAIFFGIAISYLV